MASTCAHLTQNFISLRAIMEYKLSIKHCKNLSILKIGEKSSRAACFVRKNERAWGVRPNGRRASRSVLRAS